jgi:hypothetical protein
MSVIPAQLIETLLTLFWIAKEAYFFQLVELVEDMLEHIMSYDISTVSRNLPTMNSPTSICEASSITSRSNGTSLYTLRSSSIGFDNILSVHKMTGEPPIALSISFGC